MKALARGILVAITLLVVAIFYIPLGHSDFAGRWADGTFGMDDNAFTTTIGGFIPGTPAAKAGIHVGDRLEISPFDPAPLELRYPRVGDKRTYTFQRPNGSQYTVTMTAVPVEGFSDWARLSGILAIVPATVFLAIAFLLVYLRPSVMTWSFYAYAVGYFSTAPSFQFYQGVLPYPAFVALGFLLTTVFGNFAVMPLLPFVIRFPDDSLSGARRWVDGAIWIAIALAFAAYVLQWYVRWTQGQALMFEEVLDAWLPLATFVVATFIFVKKYKHASPQIRQRFGFLFIGLIVSFVAYAVYFVPGIPNAIKQLVGYFVIAMPVTVAYAVLRHRVIDVNFVLNRTISYGLLSLVVIAVVSLLDWIFAKIVSEQHLAILGELGATIAIGFLLDRINKWIESIVEWMFFRERRAAEAYVKRAASALPYATDEAAVTQGLVDIPVDSLELAAGALYRRSANGGRFEGVATSQRTAVAPAGFDANDLLVRLLQSDEKEVWLDSLRHQLDETNAAAYVLAVPVTVRHQLVSFTLYGAHENGSQLDPDEVALLLELSREASRAYDHIEAVRMRERYARFTSPSLETA